MVYTKRYFIEITTLETVSTEKVFLSLSKNITQSCIKIFEVYDDFSYGDVKNVSREPIYKT